MIKNDLSMIKNDLSYIDSEIEWINNRLNSPEPAPSIREIRYLTKELQLLQMKRKMLNDTAVV